MEELLLPSKIEITPGESDNKATLVVSPCFHGYGTTLGNALRRTLLSSLPGAAVTAVKISGATHEFDALEGVKEDVLEIVLNLKALRLKLHSDESVRLELSKKGVGAVTAADIGKNADVEIVNPDLRIATLTDKKAELEMEIIVDSGRGYGTIEERTKERGELGVIVVDAAYSPVREVGWKVENVRVGDITNYDKLIMDIETDGTITPEEAVDQAVKILLDHFTLILSRGDEDVVPATVEEELIAPLEEEEAAAAEGPEPVEGEEEVEEKKEKKKAKKETKKATKATKKKAVKKK